MAARVLTVFAILLVVALFETIHSSSHPIPKLMSDAESNFEQLISGQSASLDAAVREYRRRYKRNPPKGFNDWFAFAQENDVKIIDEYDSMINDLSPFWDFSGAEFRRRAQQVGQLPSIDLVRLKSGKTATLNIPKRFNDSEGNARAKGFRVMIEKFQSKLPDMDFPINAKAEGRILVPWEHVKYPNTSQQDSSDGVERMLGGEFTPDWRGDGNVWEEFRRTCDPASQARRLFGSLRASSTVGNAQGQRPMSYLRCNAGPLDAETDADFQFVARPDDNFDFCSQPWARFQQGHYFSDWRTIPILYPVFSPAKAPGFSDILIPSHYYYSSTTKYTYGWDPKNMVVKDVDDDELPWEEKTNDIFWRGATTGGGSSPRGFLSSYQRHRFIEMAGSKTNTTRTVVFEDPPGTGHYTTATVPLASMNNEFMNTAFTKAVGCQSFPTGCDGMLRHYRFSETVPMGEHWRHKYLIDMDGMGYSARMMALLASDSAVLKATVYREFFTDWIQPWLHYIPLSQSYQEIYNIHAFFSGASSSMLKAANSSALAFIPGGVVPANDGDRRLRRIARAGREWKQTVGRTADMEAYVYRLCLEYARLWADDRDAMAYTS
ncbi:glycosyltransferase family 90 protein [Ramaria rubella]|nr:glycosyltransferase family 90 protein [Ramaria rubella]